VTILGTLKLRDWDTGAMTTLGGEVTNYVVDSDTRSIYAAAVPGLDSGLSQLGGRVPFYFDNPEDVYQEVRLPNFTFRRSELIPAFDRQPWYQWVARRQAKGSNEVIVNGERGYDRYANQWRANPFDIMYDVTLSARRQQDSMLMLDYALRHYLPPWFTFGVVDSLGDVRHYDAGDMTISNTSELVDMADRTIGWTIAFTVRAEIDLVEDEEHPAVTQIDVAYERYNPNSAQV
jgi:hypothetical protein